MSTGILWTDKDAWRTATSIYDFTAVDIYTGLVSMEKYRGKVLLVVNVASKCLLTETNYRDLVELQESLNDESFRIVAFPCNQFAGGERGSTFDIITFAQSHHVHFDLFDRVDVNGKNTHPLWRYLKMKQSGTLGSFIKWNFTKFLVDRNGQVVERHGPRVKSIDLLSRIWYYLKN